MSDKKSNKGYDSSKVDELIMICANASRSTTAVIDALTQRGAFRGEELSSVGKLRDQAIHLVQLCEELQASEG